jgi:hypothetical protein
MGTLNYQTLIQDSILIGNKAWDVAKVDGANIRNASISAFQSANSTLQHDWVVMNDPNTWDSLRNETYEEIEKLEEQTEDLWSNINDAGRKEWSDIGAESEQKWHELKDASEKEWEVLSLFATEKWNDIENVTEDRWSQWSESISTEFDRLPNQTENAYHRMGNEARAEWHHFTNQTYRDWLKISKSVQKKWMQILKYTRNEWGRGSMNADHNWNHTDKYVNQNSNGANEIGIDESNITHTSSKNENVNKNSNVTNEIGVDESNVTYSSSKNETGWQNTTEISSKSDMDDETNVTDLTKISKNKLHKKERTSPTHEMNSTENLKPKQYENDDNSTELNWNNISNSTQEALIHLIDTTKHKWHNITKTTRRKWHDLVKASNDTISHTRHHLKNLSETGEMEWKNITENSGETFNNIHDSSIIWWNDLRGGISSTINSTGQALTEAKDAAKKKTSVVGEFVKDEWDEVSSPATREKVKDTSIKMIQDAKNASSNGIEFLKEKIDDVMNGISGNETRDSSIRRLLDDDEMIPYDWGWGYYAYMISVCAIFMGTIILEGVDTSIMCKAAPARLNTTFINVGLLATLIGTLGRVIGDGLITASAFIDKSRYTDFINNVYFPLIPITILGIYFVYKYYNTLL